jgi:hypothetical protein
MLFLEICMICSHESAVCNQQLLWALLASFGEHSWATFYFLRKRPREEALVWEFSWEIDWLDLGGANLDSFIFQSKYLLF